MKNKKTAHVVAVGDRDLGILKLCLEMRFCDLEVISKSFFNPEKVTAAATSRIQDLEKAGFLKGHFLIPGSRRKVYTTTMKGYRTLTERLDEVLPRPLSVPAQATFNHDYLVLKVRAELEKQGRASDWLSERKLKAMMSDSRPDLARSLLPDGVYRNRAGSRVALEVEISPKTSARLEAKVLEFLKIMNSDTGFFQHTFFLCAHNSTVQTLKKITAPYGQRFVVSLLSDLLTPKA